MDRMPRGILWLYGTVHCRIAHPEANNQEPHQSADQDTDPDADRRAHCGADHQGRVGPVSFRTPRHLRHSELPLQIGSISPLQTPTKTPTILIGDGSTCEKFLTGESRATNKRIQHLFVVRRIT